MLKSVIKTAVILTHFMVLIHAVSTQADEIYFIDAHSQVDDTVPLETIISLMKQGGVNHTILSGRGKLQGKALL